MYTVPFIIYITVWLTLLCVLFDFYWICIKIFGESVPSRPDRTEIIYKELGEPYQIGKVLRALFSPRKVYSKKLHKATEKIKKGCEYMTNAKQTNCAKYARGPPKWIRTDSLSHLAQIRPVWGRCHAQHTDTKQPTLPPFWRVCEAVGRREPYNLTIESKTYYTKNFDNMR